LINLRKNKNQSWRYASVKTCSLDSRHFFYMTAEGRQIVIKGNLRIIILHFDNGAILFIFTYHFIKILIQWYIKIRMILVAYPHIMTAYQN